jgi:hypothetical protein
VAPPSPPHRTTVPPFPSVTDAVTAFDADASNTDSAELQCDHCGTAGGFLHGAWSALTYCSSPRCREGGECKGGGVGFCHGPSYQWLLGLLGLDGGGGWL